MYLKGIIKDAKELEFVIFCIEQVYKVLTEKSDILKGYIVPEYEILHTQSKEYIVNDIIELMKEKGVEV